MQRVNVAYPGGRSQLKRFEFSDSLDLSDNLELTVRRVNVHRALGDLRELAVGCLLFVQRLLQQLSSRGMSQPFSERASSAVAGDLVVLNALGSGNQRRVAHIVVALRVNHLIPL